MRPDGAFYPNLLPKRRPADDRTIIHRMSVWPTIAASGITGATAVFGYIFGDRASKRTNKTAFAQIDSENKRVIQQITDDNERLREQHREDHLRNRQAPTTAS
jgi:F420-0:gamma-glutamyl ligase-like protein